MGKILPLFLIVFLVGSCAIESEAPPELESAIAALMRMTSPAMLRNEEGCIRSASAFRIQPVELSRSRGGSSWGF
jgi:hypothetical protein